MAAMKIYLTKNACTLLTLLWYRVIPTKKISTRKFIIPKFHDTKISRSMVIQNSEILHTCKPKVYYYIPSSNLLFFAVIR